MNCRIQLILVLLADYKGWLRLLISYIRVTCQINKFECELVNQCAQMKFLLYHACSKLANILR